MNGGMRIITVKGEDPSEEQWGAGKIGGRPCWNDFSGREN